MILAYISHVYVKDPDTYAWRPGQATGRTGRTRSPLWPATRRIDRGGSEIQRRPVQEGISDPTRNRRNCCRRQNTPKAVFKEMTRARHATEAKKPYADFTASSASAQAKLDPDRPREYSRSRIGKVGPDHLMPAIVPLLQAYDAVRIAPCAPRRAGSAIRPPARR